MKITTSCEREFIEKCVRNGKRIDGRSLATGRSLEIKFSEEWGCCIVSMGNTRVLAQATSEVTEPKAGTPTEGSLHINVELFVSSADSVSRTSDEFIETQRCLERCIRDSKCVDLESLCIVAGSKVWTVRVDVHALCDDGNFLECMSVAAISALSHFKRPDITVVGTEVTEYSMDDREPVSLNLHHMPIIVNLALYDQGERVVVDPTYLEEKISEGCYIIGINAHQEICFIHRSGVLLLQKSIVEKCEDIAIRRAQLVTQAIRKALDNDAYNRATKTAVGFSNMIETSSILSAKHKVHDFHLDSITQVQEEVIEVQDSQDVSVSNEDEKLKTENLTTHASATKERALAIIRDGEKSVFQGGSSKWNVESSEESSSDESPDKSTLAKTPMKKESDVSSEEEIGVMDSEEVDMKPNSVRGWYSKSPFS